MRSSFSIRAKKRGRKSLFCGCYHLVRRETKYVGVKGSFTEYVRTKQVTYARHYPRTDNDLSLETSPGKLNMSKANKPNQTTYTQRENRLCTGFKRRSSSTETNSIENTYSPSSLARVRYICKSFESNLHNPGVKKVGSTQRVFIYTFKILFPFSLLTNTALTIPDI